MTSFHFLPQKALPPSPPENILSINSVQPSFCGWMVPLSVWAWLQTAEYWKIASGCVRQHTYCRTPWGVPDCLWSTCLKDREWMMHCLCVCVFGRYSSTACISHVMAIINGLTLLGSKSDLFREHKLSIPLGPSVWKWVFWLIDFTNIGTFALVCKCAHHNAQCVICKLN